MTDRIATERFKLDNLGAEFGRDLSGKRSGQAEANGRQRVADLEYDSAVERLDIFEWTRGSVR